MVLPDIFSRTRSLCGVAGFFPNWCSRRTNLEIGNNTGFSVCFFSFQAEHPLVLQIKQRRSLKPHFIVLGGFYGVISGASALYLYLNFLVLLWIYLGALAALVVDAFSVLNRKQKSIFNELITFAAVCLSNPFAYAATTGTISLSVMALWMLNTLYFSSTIFTVKLRKPKTSSVIPGVVITRSLL